MLDHRSLVDSEHFQHEKYLALREGYDSESSSDLVLDFHSTCLIRPFPVTMTCPARGHSQQSIKDSVGTICWPGNCSSEGPFGALMHHRSSTLAQISLQSRLASCYLRVRSSTSWALHARQGARTSTIRRTSFTPAFVLPLAGLDTS